MTPEMTVSPLYIRISRELIFKLHSHISIVKIINFDKIYLGTIVLCKRALFTRHIRHVYVIKYFISMAIAQHGTR